MAIYGTSKYWQSTYGSQAEHPYLNVSGKIIWIMQVDWDRDGSFGVEIEPQTFQTVKFFSGRKKRVLPNGQGQEQPDQETFWITLLDTSARYDFFNSSSPLYNYLGFDGQLMRLMAISTTTKQTVGVFVGTIASVTYNAQSQVATIIGEGLSRQLQIGNAEFLYSPTQGDGNDYPYESCFIRNGSTPYPVNWWSGRLGGTYLRECARLTLEQAGWTLGMYSGQVAYNDDYPDYFYLSNESAWAALKELADGFAARLFFLGDGRLFVMDRQDVLGVPGSLTPIAGALLSFGLDRPASYDVLRNWVEVKIRPHSVRPFNYPDVAADYTLVWSNPGPITLPVFPFATTNIDIEFSNNAKPVQGSFVTFDTAGGVVDGNNAKAFLKSDRTGTDLATTFTAGVLEILSDLYYDKNQQRGKVILFNNSGQTVYIFDVNVYAIGIVESGQSGISSKSDAGSIALNNTRKLFINTRWNQSLALADNIAQAYVDALSQRERVFPATLAYMLTGDSLIDLFVNHPLGSYVDFGLAGGATALANFGLYGRRLIVGQEMEWVNGDGQGAIVKLTYERIQRWLVTLVGTTTTKTANTSATPSWSHTVPTGNNRLLVVVVGLRAFQTVTPSVTYGSQSLTKLGAVQYAAGNYARAEIWYLVAPVVGTGTITVNISGAEVVEAAAMNFVNVNQTTPMGTFVSTSGLGGASASVNVTGAEDDLVLDVLVKEAGTLTVGAGQTSLWAASGDGSWKGSGSSEPVRSTSTTVNMAWSLTGANAWVLGAVAIKSIVNS